MKRKIIKIFLGLKFFVCGALLSMNNEQQVLMQKRTSERTKLSSLNHLNKNLRVQGQQRRATPLSVRPVEVEVSDDEVRIDVTQLPKKGKKKEVQPRSRVPQPRVMEPVYTQDHIQEVLSATNPVLYNFGQKKQIPVDQLLEYANLLQEYHLEPAAIVEFIKSHNDLDKTKPKSWEVKQYEDIQKNDPEKYMEIALSVIKKIQDQSVGQQKTSVMNTTHVGILHDQVAGQQDTLYKGKIAFVVQTLLTIGTFAWGIYGQISSSSASTCLNATHT